LADPQIAQGQHNTERHLDNPDGQDKATGQRRDVENLDQCCRGD